MYKVVVSGNLAVIEDVCRPRVVPHGKRGQVNGLSKGSRGRFIRTVNRLLFDPGDALFVTLTYHNNLCDAHEAKSDLRTLIKRLHRRHKEAGFVWVAERQKRGAIHFHVLVIHAGSMTGEEISGAWHDITDKWSEAHALYGTLALPAAGDKAVAYLASYLAKGGLKKGDGRAWGMEYCKRYLDVERAFYVKDDDISLDLFKGFIFDGRLEWGYYLAGDMGKVMDVDKLLNPRHNDL